MATVSNLPEFEFNFDGSYKSSKRKAGAGAVLWVTMPGSSTKEMVWTCSESLGKRTNNEAEYRGFIMCLEAARRFEIPKIIVKGDSKLVVNQFNGSYKVKAAHLVPLWTQAMEIAADLVSIEVLHIDREYNSVADKLSNDGDCNITTSSFTVGWNADRILGLIASSPVAIEDRTHHQVDAVETTVENEVDQDEVVGAIATSNAVLPVAHTSSITVPAAAPLPSMAPTQRAASIHPCPCNDCGSRFTTREGLRKHLGYTHQDADLAEINSTCSSFGTPFTRCHCCRNYFIGAHGLQLHRVRIPSCALATVATSDSNAAANAMAAAEVLTMAASLAHPVTSSAPLPCPSIDSCTDLHDLVSQFRRSIDNPSLKLRELMGRLVLKLLSGMSVVSSDPLGPARNAAAFLAMPGIMRLYSDLKLSTVNLMYEAIAAPAPAAFLLRCAQNLVRGGYTVHPEPRVTPGSRHQRLKKVDHLCTKGRRRMALQIVEELHASSAASPPPLRLTVEEQRSKLASLHPEGNDLDTLPPQSGNPLRRSTAMQFTADGLEQSIRNLDLSVSAGWSGWSNLLIIKTVLHSPMRVEIIASLCAFFTTWVDGSLPAQVANMFAVARGVLVPKDEGSGVRPLGIGEAWYRLFGRYILSRLGVIGSLLPLQMGGGARSGVEIAARVCQLALDMDSDSTPICVGSLDIKNAFNSIRRSLILNGIRKHCPVLEPIFRLFYGAPTEVRLSDGSLACYSSTGVRQGDPLSNLLFSVGFMDALEDIRESLSRHVRAKGLEGYGHVIAYADDVNFSCPTSCIQAFGTDVKAILANYDIPLAVEKCSVFGRGTGDLDSLPFPVQSRGLRRVLGVPIGPVGYRREVLREQLMQMANSLPTVVRLPTQLAYILTVQCINARACYVARIVETEEDRSALDMFDSIIDDALLSIADCPPSHKPLLRVIRSLPQRMGGLGVHDVCGLHGLLDLNKSRTKTMEFLEKYKLSPLYRQCANSWSPTLLHDGFAIPGETPSPVMPLNLALDFAKDRRTEMVSKILADKLAANQRTDAAIFLSSQTPNSGRWLTFRGGEYGSFRMYGSAFRLALQRKILAPPSPQQLEDRLKPCRCGASLEIRSHPTHREDCASNQYYFDARHTTICNLLQRYLKVTFPNTPVHREVEITGARQPAKMDVVLNRGSGKFYIDVAVTNPACHTNIQIGAATKPDAASESREKMKTQKYFYVPNLPGEGPHYFVPFIIESTGRLGKQAIKFLKECRDELNPRPLTTLLTSISACLALYNSLMAANSTRRLNRDEELVVTGEH